MFSRRAAAGVPGPRTATPGRAVSTTRALARPLALVGAAAGVSASLDAGTTHGRIHNALKNTEGTADLHIHATTGHGDIAARSPEQQHAYSDNITRRSRPLLTTEEGKTMTIKQPAWTGMVPVDDTALAVADSGGPAVWSFISTARMPTSRTGGRSSPNSGRTFGISPTTSGLVANPSARRTTRSKACLRDVDAVLEAREIDRPILVGRDDQVG
jgi:hypothetical protein